MLVYKAIGGRQLTNRFIDKNRRRPNLVFYVTSVSMQTFTRLEVAH